MKDDKHQAPKRRSNALALTILSLMIATALSTRAQIDGQETPAGRRQGTSPPRQRTPLLSSTYVDLDGNGKKELVELRMTSGKLFEAEEGSCLGFRKYEGKFSIAVWVEGKPLEQSLNALWGNEVEEMFFHAEPFRLGFHDYNHDGQPDFNIGQYENCNGWTYRLFTIARDGTITPLRIEGFGEGLHTQAVDNSTAEIRETSSGFSAKEYNNGDENCMPCTKVFAWDKEKQAFKLARRIPAKN